VTAVAREATARRMARWRIRLLFVSFLKILLALAVVFVILPAGIRPAAGRALLISLVYLGAVPVFGSLMQYVLAGLHYFRIPYDRLEPYYPNTTVVVPAWNEAAVIGRTIDHLLAMEYPEERLRVIVVDDASTDDTPSIVRAKAEEYPGRVVHLRRERGGQGKAYTLNHGIAHALSGDWTEAVLVTDADVLFEKDALRKMTRHLSDPNVGAVTAYIKEGSQPDHAIARFIAFEYATAQAVGRRAQNILGALACLAGGAQLHARDNLEAIGGRIDTSTLAEDTVTTFETQLSGRRVEFDGNAVVWAEEPADLNALWKQRLRWARGNFQVSLQYASMWGKQRPRFGRLGRWPFKLVWYSSLLMPLLLTGASASLVSLYAMHATSTWSAFRFLWIWHAIAYVFGTALALAIDLQTARRAWFEAIMFPGVVSLAIIAYSVLPRSHEPTLPSWLILVMYSWLFLSVPLAWFAKVLAQYPRCRWLSVLLIYVAGYGPYLCAVIAASYMAELRNAAAAWDKTVKIGRVSLGPSGPSVSPRT
jgi:cellulose synthase/poly-beta-1,6-N-acetylglucosamine synthase-like glycosyltransferase